MTGSFQSGYLAELAVNGFSYHAVLFSPYLALNAPGGMYPQTLQSALLSPKAQEQPSADGASALPILPDESGVLDPTIDAKAEDEARQTLNAPPQVDFVPADLVQSALPQ